MFKRKKYGISRKKTTRPWAGIGVGLSAPAAPGKIRRPVQRRAGQSLVVETMRKIANFFGLQIGWFACALGAANSMPLIGPAVVTIHLAIHFIWSDDRKREAAFLLFTTLLGILIDSAQKAAGFIVYASAWPPVDWLAPIWIVAMWLLFATTFSTSLSWLQGRYAIASLMGAIFGPLSYVAGERLGAIAFAQPLLQTVFIFGLIWAIVMPALAWFAKQLRRTDLADANL